MSALGLVAQLSSSVSPVSIGAVIYEPGMANPGDDRRGIEQFAAEIGYPLPLVREAYAATGEIHCGRIESTANLVLRNDLAVFSAHAYLNYNTCQLYTSTDQCTISFETTNGNIETAGITRVIENGLNCPSDPPRNYSHSAVSAQHWIVAELNREIPGVTPYNVNLDALPIPTPSTQVVTVSHADQLDFILRLPNGDPVIENSPRTQGLIGIYQGLVYPEAYSSTCRVMDVLWYRAITDVPLFRTTCDGAQKSSGGALLDAPSAYPTLLAIRMGGKETADMLLDVTDPDRRDPLTYPGFPGVVTVGVGIHGQNHGQYDPLFWNSSYVGVSGRFLQVLRENAQNELAIDIITNLHAVLNGLTFNSGSADFAPGSELAVRRLRQALIVNPTWSVRIEGYTDAAGDEVANRELSQRRAEAVRDWLVGMGIECARLETAGLGEANPVATNDTAAGRAQNRRIEVVLATPDETQNCP